MTAGPAITIVSLGAGAPEEITLRALRALRTADRIYVPGRAARTLLEELDVPEEKTTLLELPMSSDRRGAAAVYSRLARQLREDLAAGLRSAVVTIGDAGTYAGASCVTRLLRTAGVPYSVLPGVTCYAAAAAHAGLPLTEGDGALLVLGGETTAERLRQALDEGQTVVVMKLSRSEAAVRALLADRPQLHLLYAERLGDPERERIVTRAADLPEDPFPYFSLLILYPTDE